MLIGILQRANFNNNTRYLPFTANTNLKIGYLPACPSYCKKEIWECLLEIYVKLSIDCLYHWNWSAVGKADNLVENVGQILIMSFETIVPFIKKHFKEMYSVNSVYNFPKKIWMTGAKLYSYN